MFGFFRSKPKDLRSLVFQALAGPRPAAVALCRQRREEIWKEWPSWAQHLMMLQGRPADAKSYADSLRAVAEIFHQELGDPRLMRLFGEVPEDDDAVAVLYQRLSQARSLIQELKLEQALVTLLALLDEAQGEGPERFQLRAFAFGDMGQAHFFRGEFEDAERFVKMAWKMCREMRDLEGMENHQEGLFELLRYQDRREEARALALEQARFLRSLELPAPAAAWQERADGVVAEPLLRVQVYFQGKCFELDQMPPRQDGSLQVAFRRNRITLFPAQSSTKAGRALAERGQLAQARALFEAAEQSDRYDPECRMLLGLVAMDEGHFAEAVAKWEECERLAPGYFHVRSDLWFARQLASGQLSAPQWELWRELEDGHLEPLHLLERSAKLPLAGGHFHRGQALQKLGRQGEARAAFQDALAQVSEPHLKTRILLALGGMDGDREVLQQAVATNGCLVSGAMARWLLQPT